MELICYDDYLDDIYEESTDFAEQDEEMPLDVLQETFTPRSYQIELFEFAKEKNSIMVLGTGSGKTFISILLIKELAENIRGTLNEGAKRTVFLVNTVPLVYQQMEAIKKHTGFSVGHYEGSMGVDLWTEEKWKDELNKHEVLVMVAQIFKDLILHDYLPLKKINLLIMDECHHATGNHPMREVMREYNKLKCEREDVPRIMGLTACVIHKKCKPEKIQGFMISLENVMDSVLVTSQDPEMVKKHTTKPTEMIISCPAVQTSLFYERAVQQLRKIKDNMLERIEFCERSIKYQLKKFVSREIESIIDVSVDLGEYMLSQAVKIQAEYLKDCDAETSTELEILHDLGRQLDAISFDHINFEDNIYQYVSGKVRRLVELLKRCEDKEIVTLVFVTRRSTAKLLCSLLLKLKDCIPELKFLLPECVIGGTFNMKSDLKINEEILKQKKTIENFRKGLCNLIVSTSVLEEGIDIKKCNMVVRFNASSNYRSYVQSLGRARAVPSYFITLSYVEEVEEVRENRDCFRKINDYLNVLCHDRELPDISTARKDFEEDELEPPFAPYGIPGPQITSNSAIQLVNRYCGTLPQDKFTKLSVTVTKRKVGETFYVDLSLPMNSPFRMKITSKPMENFENAKKSAAFELCKRLFYLKAFNDHLLPKKSKIEAEENLTKYLGVDVESGVKGQPQPGTRKRRQVYKRRICEPFQKQKSFTTNYHLYKVYFQHMKSVENELLIDTDFLSTYLGFICDGELNCASFPLFSKKWGEVNIIIEKIKVVNCGGIMKDIREFHRVVSQFLNKLNMNIMNFDHDKGGHSLYMIPLTKNNIDLDKLRDVSALKIKSFDDMIKELFLTNGHRNGYRFHEESYKDGVIIPLYRDLEIYYVIDILFNESPLSPFPDFKKEFSSYKDYLKKKYNVEVHHDDQPLIESKHFSKEFNYLEVAQPTTKTIQSLHPKFVPEMCMVLPFAATFFCQLLCMASVLHRINGLQIEQEVFDSIGYSCNDEVKNSFKYSVLDYNWVAVSLQHIRQNGWANICLALRNKTSMFINPGMILQALTPLHTKESFNLERLEILGDSYLKFSVGNYLFCKEFQSHEGVLTIQRSNLVSNRTLYSLAKRHKLGEAFQGVLLAPATATPFGFHVKEEMEEKLKREKVAPEDWPSYKTIKAGSDPVRAESKPCDEPYNPWTEQMIPDKSIADLVEALIGVYLLSGGEKAANHFMDWLGLTFMKEDVTVPRTAIFLEVNAGQAISQVKSLYKKNCLDRLEDQIQYTFNDKSFLVQAVTHPSYQMNKATDCYQRLEFYGDAILDYLVTGYIFANFENYNPGQLTDLRSHYVKNETLARIAVKFGFQKYILHEAPKLSFTIDLFIKMVKDGEKEFNTEEDTLENEDIEVPKTLGDIVESLIGAVYIDSGKSLDITWKLIELLLKDELEATKTSATIPIDSVRELYERNPNVVLECHPPTEDEPAKCIVKIPGYKDLTGTGKNKRTAKQAAAKLALNHLKFMEESGIS